MNKLNVGDYVRTKNGTIAKIKKLFKKEDYIFLDVNNYICGKQNIIKSSPNIIDLIEVGDYVNGEYVTYINKKDSYVDVGYDDAILRSKDFKSIVTKESFENISYKVGDDITDFKKEFPEAACLLKDTSDKLYEIIDEINKLKEDK